jgi:hypothetical protein
MARDCLIVLRPSVKSPAGRRTTAFSVDVRASAPGLDSGAHFVGKIGSLRAPDHRSQWS